MKSKKQISFDCSRAGVLGSSVRWHGHVRIPTTLVRVYQNDADFIFSLRPSFRSVADFVRHSICLYRDSIVSSCKKLRKSKKKL